MNRGKKRIRRTRLALMLALCAAIGLAGAARGESGWTAIDAAVDGWEGDGWYTEEALTLTGTAQPNAALQCKVHCPGVAVNKTVQADADGHFTIPLTAEECSLGSGGTIFAYISYADYEGEDARELAWSSPNIDWDCNPPQYSYETEYLEDGRRRLRGWTDGSSLVLLKNEEEIRATVEYDGTFVTDAFIARPGDRFALRGSDDAGNSGEERYVPADTEIGGLEPLERDVYVASDAIRVEGWYASLDPDRKIELYLCRVAYDPEAGGESLTPVGGAILPDNVLRLAEDDLRLENYRQSWHAPSEVRTGCLFQTDLALNQLEQPLAGQYKLALRWYDDATKNWYVIDESRTSFTVLDGNEEGRSAIAARVEGWEGGYYTEPTLRLEGSAEPGARLTCRVHGPNGAVDTAVSTDGEGRFSLELDAADLGIPPEGYGVFIEVSYPEGGADGAWASGTIEWDCQGPSLEVRSRKLKNDDGQFYGATDASTLVVERNDEPVEAALLEDGTFQTEAFPMVPGDAFRVRAWDGAGNLTKKYFEVQRKPDTQIGYVWLTSGYAYAPGDALAISGWYACLDPLMEVELGLYRVERDEDGTEHLRHVGEALDMGEVTSMEDDPSRLEVHRKLWPNETNVAVGYDFRTKASLADFDVYRDVEYLLVLRWYDAEGETYREIGRSEPFFVTE